MSPDETNLDVHQSLLPLNGDGPSPSLSTSPAIPWVRPTQGPSRNSAQQKKRGIFCWISELNWLTWGKTRDKAEEQEGDLVLQPWQQEERERSTERRSAWRRRTVLLRCRKQFWPPHPTTCYGWPVPVQEQPCSLPGSGFPLPILCHFWAIAALLTQQKRRDLFYRLESETG